MHLLIDPAQSIQHRLRGIQWYILCYSFRFGSLALEMLVDFRRELKKILLFSVAPTYKNDFGYSIAPS